MVPFNLSTGKYVTACICGCVHVLCVCWGGRGEGREGGGRGGREGGREMGGCGTVGDVYILGRLTVCLAYFSHIKQTIQSRDRLVPRSPRGLGLSLVVDLIKVI